MPYPLAYVYFLDADVWQGSLNEIIDYWKITWFRRFIFLQFPAATTNFGPLVESSYCLAAVSLKRESNLSVSILIVFLELYP